MKLKLISFRICPFVQKSVITLYEKNQDFDIEYINLENKPDWFLDISPEGKVPVLLVDEKPLFESNVINEFIDEITPNSLLPENPLEKAEMRAWIEFSSGLMSDFMKLVSSQEKDTYENSLNMIFSKLEKLEKVIDNKGFFRGENFSLADSAFAPFFIRFNLIPGVKEHKNWKKLEKVEKWKDNLLSRDSVIKSTDEEFYNILDKRFKNMGCYALK